jgi:methylated-DNA-[protein]-cysteine S-methyltransferase
MGAADASPAPPAPFARFDTRLGRCAILWSPRGITGLVLPERTPTALLTKVRERAPKGVAEAEPNASVQAAMDAVTASLEGSLDDLSGVAVDLEGTPAFHQRVYVLARAIAPGSTLSYGALAERAGSPGGSRAVGQAMQRNPVPVVIPCHRVLAADGRIGGFSAGGGTETKLKMLTRERVARLRAERPARFAFEPTEALAHLRQRDPSLGALIDRVGAFRMELDPTPSVFAALAEAIVYQQLTGRAAETIYTRVCGLFANGHEGPTAEGVARVSDELLRGAGLSSAKALALKDLAKRTLDKSVPPLETLAKMSDEDVVARLSAVRGVGAWTVEMLLMFRLGRPDVLPLDDYGVRKGFARAFGLDELPSKRALAEHGARWAPFRSVASWYLWRANELPEPR